MSATHIDCRRRDRGGLRLAGMAGLDTEMVARLLGRSPGAIRVAAHHGLHRLAGMLAEAGVTR